MTSVADLTTLSTGLLIERLVFGVLMMAHSTQKLFGWLGGYGIAGTAGYFEGLGFRPGRPYVLAASLSELIGGLLIALGLPGPGRPGPGDLGHDRCRRHGSPEPWPLCGDQRGRGALALLHRFAGAGPHRPRRLLARRGARQFPHLVAGNRTDGDRARDPGCGG